MNSYVSVQPKSENLVHSSTTEDLLGTEHPSTLAIMFNLAFMWRNLDEMRMPLN
jgi:hypothetical protein